MGNEIIIYASRYGSAKRYAEELSKRLRAPAVDYRKAKKISECDRVIYIGALYAGTIMGLEKTLSKLSLNISKAIAVISVGLVDPSDPENITAIREGIKKQMSKDLYDRMKIYHLRGAMRHSQLSLLHRMMMNFMYKKLRKMPPEELSPAIQTLLDNYGKEADYVDVQALEPIINALSQERTA